MGEKAGMDLGEWGSDGSLEEVGERNPYSENTVWKKSIFNKNVALWFV